MLDDFRPHVERNAQLHEKMDIGQHGKPGRNLAAAFRHGFGRGSPNYPAVTRLKSEILNPKCRFKTRPMFGNNRLAVRAEKFRPLTQID